MSENPHPAVAASLDTLRNLMKGGVSLEEAYRQQLGQFRAFGLGETQTQHLTDAMEIIAAAQRRIEYLQHAALKARRFVSQYPGPMPNDHFWPSYRDYLRDGKRWDRDVIDSIDESSSNVVKFLRAPGSSSFSTRGLVVGFVQSGKTANMTGVIAKAADWGYNFIIVLAGLTNLLRQQTQERLTNDLVRQAPDGSWYLHTNESSDFQIPANGSLPPLRDNVGHLAVVKKNVAPLRKLREVIGNTPTNITNRLKVLIIDDECDQASVNTRSDRYDMSAINGEIRHLVRSLERVGYIGYTATPFANVLIDPEIAVDPIPDDLYPKDFIVSLPRPKGYFGPERLFGRDAIFGESDEPDANGLDMIRMVRDEEVDCVRPATSREKDQFEPSMVESLERALIHFVLATAARHARGQGDDHSTMLVHTSVLTIVHFRLREEIRQWLELFRHDGRSRSASRLAFAEELWEEECLKVRSTEFGLQPVSFAELEPYLEEVLRKIEILVENSLSDTRTDYSVPGRKYIVVGGNVIARGLTLEGLVVSYFVRSSSQYDTLMQMGRWFGYRIGYEDLPRIWMTSDLNEAFHDLATVEAEIRDDIAEYSRRGVSPTEFAVRIRQIPGLAITARNKLGAARVCDISYSDSHVQTIRFKHENRSWLNSNWDNTAHLLDQLHQTGFEFRKSGKGLFVEGVPVSRIRTFLQGYQIQEDQRDMNSRLILDYLERADGDDHLLATWNIGIVRGSLEKESQRPLGHLGHVPLVNRSKLKNKQGDAYIKALMSRGDLLIDFDESLRPETDSWAGFKALRNSREQSKRPLLIVYPIDAVSKPANPDGDRERLDAAADVLGIGIVFPDEGIRARHWVSVELPELEHEEIEESDLLAEDEDA